jgi:glycosyltransferase involved in cell wall biosynthesis
MKIGILTHIKHPIIEPFAGGLEAFTYDITLRLQRRGHDVRLFATQGAAAELPIETMVVSGMYCGDTGRHDYDTLSSSYIAEHHAYMDCMQRIDSYGFDVILNNSLHYVPITMAGVIVTPMLSVLHTPPFFELINAIVAQRKQRLGHYCTVSHANAAAWSSFVPDCSVIPNGIDLTVWRPDAHLKGRHALWFGRLVAEKGAHLAMDAAKRAGINIRVAGKITDPDYFENEIRPRLSKDALYIGHLNREVLVSELGQATVCLVTPLWQEPFGLVVAEALACGTPVAAFSKGAMSELLSPATGVVVADGDVDALAVALRSAVQLTRQACRARAERLWDIDMMVDRYEALLIGLSNSARAHV